MSRSAAPLASLATSLATLPLHAVRLGLASVLLVACAGGESMGSDTEAASVGAMDESGPGNVTETTGVTGLTATSGMPSTETATGEPPEASSTTAPEESSTTGGEEASTTGTGDSEDATATDDGSTSGDEGSSTADDSSTETASEELVDLSGFVVHQANTARSFTFPPTTIVPTGTIVVIGRDATAGAFEQHWGVDLGDVFYFDSNDTFPAINGDETFRLNDAEGDTVDGPSIALDAGDRLQRVDPNDGTMAGWMSASEGTATPGTDTTPGDLTFISEASDASGSGAFAFEFVELHVGG